MGDLRYALRTLRRSPGFTALVVLTLALGIGATTAVFDLLNLFYWRRPPIDRPREVVAVYTTHPQPFVGPYGALSWPDFSDYRAAARTAALIAYRPTWTTIDTGTGAQDAEVYQVTGDFFATLGIRPVLGRALGPEDDRAGAPPVAVMSHALFQTLGSDPDILGRTAKIDDLTVHVVGIAPPRFRGLSAGSDVAFLLPAEVGLDAFGELESPRVDRSLQGWNVLARLPRGRSPAQLQAELQVIAERLDLEHKLANRERAITVRSAIMGHPIDQMRIGSTLGVFAAAVGLLIAIACANVSNLLLARALVRRREMGIRQSIGAGRVRLVRDSLTESLLLAIAGGSSGLLVALAVRRLMAGVFGAQIAAEMRFDHRVLGLTLLASFLATLLFGLLPAVATARVELVTALKDAMPVETSARFSAKSLLAVLQVAFALVLLVCGSLLATDLWSSRTADLGFDTENLLVAGVGLPETIKAEAGRELFGRLRERAATIPGVISAGTALLVPPLALDVTSRLVLPERPEEINASRFDVVDSEYFAALGLALHEGRLFQPQDATSGHGVVVIDRLLAEELWPGQPPLGRTLRLERARPDDPSTDYEVIGVVGSVTQFARAQAPEPTVYFSWSQRYRPALNILVRTDGTDPESVFAALRDELRQLDPTLTLTNPRTHDALRWAALVDRRLQAQTMGLFAGAGLFLALLGLFGVISYSVSRQLREIGIRIAVGARRVDVLLWVLGRGIRLAGTGIAIGLVASFWALQLLRGAVPGLGNVPPGLIAAATLFLLAAATAAVWLPAHRASGIDPLRALRQD